MIMPYFKRCAAAVTVLSIATACSLVGTLYQNATSLAMNEIDGYFDLTTAQEAAGKERTDALMAWHRREVLPLYVRQMRAVAEQAPQGFTAAQAAATLDWGTGELRRVTQYALPQQAELLTSLSEKQIVFLERKLAKEDRKYRKEWLDASREDALELRHDKLMTWVERIYGNFSAEQKVRTRALSDARVFDPKLEFNDRLARQASFVALVKALAKNKPAAAEAASRLTPAQVQPQMQTQTQMQPQNQVQSQAQSPALTQAQAQIASFTASLETLSEHNLLRRQQLAELIAQISQIATPAQRNTARNTLLGYANTFEGLSRGR
jgi:Family of unknown function (DUF6279)